ncbi:hypothetical protein Zmor_014492 [Zophobas morio]|uniref:Uncharacterized protein n=1 Tax=Zophobas morio TaxID=2755281 RepID=A0AA38MGH4_9CUCU|nr:hypothetical protein Zmor_014492 [Zophobas morio]
MTLVNRRPVTIGGKTKNWHNANWDAPGFSRTIGEHFPAIGAHFPATYRIGTNTQNARSRRRGPVEVSFASCASPGLRWPLVFSPQPFSRLPNTVPLPKASTPALVVFTQRSPLSFFFFFFFSFASSLVAPAELRRRVNVTLQDS